MNAPGWTFGPDSIEERSKKGSVLWDYGQYCNSFWPLFDMVWSGAIPWKPEKKSPMPFIKKTPSSMTTTPFFPDKHAKKPMRHWKTVNSFSLTGSTYIHCTSVTNPSNDWGGWPLSMPSKVWKGSITVRQGKVMATCSSTTRDCSSGYSKNS